MPRFDLDALNSCSANWSWRHDDLNYSGRNAIDEARNKPLARQGGNYPQEKQRRRQLPRGDW